MEEADAAYVLLLLHDQLETNADWLIYAAGGGYIHVKNSDRYLLPPGMPAPNDNTSLVWIMSVYHQLHCLVSTTPCECVLLERCISNQLI